MSALSVVALDLNVVLSAYKDMIAPKCGEHDTVTPSVKVVGDERLGECDS